MKKTNPLSIKKIEKIANNLRIKFGIPNFSAFQIFEIIEYFHLNGILTLQILDDNNQLFESNTPVKYNPIDNFIYIKESVLYELETNEYRSNFTLAHELFHFIQNKILNFHFEEVQSCPCYCNAEWQANEFAGQLLIPTECLKNNFDYKKIAETLQVSEECSLTRLLYYKKRLKI